MEILAISHRQRGSLEPLILQHPHWESVTPATQDAIHLLARLEFIQRYYLAGGTGLALHFGHRHIVFSSPN